MKNPKKLTRAMKIKLSNKGFNANDFVLLKEDNDTFTVQRKDKLKTEEEVYTINKYRK